MPKSSLQMHWSLDLGKVLWNGRFSRDFLFPRTGNNIKKLQNTIPLTRQKCDTIFKVNAVLIKHVVKIEPFKQTQVLNFHCMLLLTYRGMLDFHWMLNFHIIYHKKGSISTACLISTEMTLKCAILFLFCFKNSSC